MKDNVQEAAGSSEFIMVGRDANGSKLTVEKSTIEKIIQQQLRVYKQGNTNVSRKKLPKWVYWVWLISIIAIGFSIAALFIRVSYNWNVEFLSTAIILSFVGILATFVVISNYMQVAGVENKVEEKYKRLEKKLTNTFEKTISEAEHKFTDAIILERIFTYRDVKFYHNAISLTMASINGKLLNNCSNKNTINALISVLNSIIKRIKIENSSYSLNDEEKDTFIRVLYKIDESETVNSIIDFFKSSV